MQEKEFFWDSAGAWVFFIQQINGIQLGRKFGN
jgi:hypothetical protein